jgi:hypothetical protein
MPTETASSRLFLEELVISVILATVMVFSCDYFGAIRMRAKLGLPVGRRSLPGAEKNFRPIGDLTLIAAICGFHGPR